MRHSLFYILCIASVSLSAPASAAQVDILGHGHFNLDMETVEGGQFGNISYTHPDYLFTRTWGNLPANSKIIFSYTFNGPVATESGFTTTGSYEYFSGGDHVYGNAYSASYTPPLTGWNEEYANGFINDAASVPLVFAAANVLQGENTAQWSVVNYGTGVAYFENIMNFSSTPGFASITYAVSAVPLPAALPMFGMLLASLLGFSRVKRTRLEKQGG